MGLPYPAFAPAMASEPMGRRLMFSTPHASTTSSTPEAIKLYARLVASCEEPHWESTVMQGTSLAPPCASQAVRETFIAWTPTWLIHPPTTCPTSEALIPARPSTPFRTCPSTSVG